MLVKGLIVIDHTSFFEVKNNFLIPLHDCCSSIAWHSVVFCSNDHYGNDDGLVEQKMDYKISK
jgi:hypothetical protein